MADFSFIKMFDGQAGPFTVNGIGPDGKQLSVEAADYAELTNAMERFRSVSNIAVEKTSPILYRELPLPQICAGDGNR